MRLSLTHCAAVAAIAPLLFTRPPAASAPAQADAEWRNVGGDPGCMRWSPLKQIDRDNVKDLKIAWVYQTGDAGQGTTIECTPIVAEGVMYVTTVTTKVVALDPATGNEIWKYDPYEGPGRPRFGMRASGGVNRGVAWWSDGKPGGRRRILLGAPDSRLISIDARTGKLDTAFGQDGVIDMRQGLDYDVTHYPYGPTSAPVIFENLVILGYSASEGPGPGAPGDTRAFDVRTGNEVWRFHSVPRPGEYGADTWEPGSWQKRSGANAWGGLSVDTKRGIVYGGYGSANFDFYGGDRKGDNLFANCTVALDARTGKRLWHFQAVHHDLWDHDLPTPPALIRVKNDGKMVDAAAQVTKTGYVFLFDRATGKPLFNVVEKPVPPSTIEGERAASTQPFPVKPPPFALQKFDEEDATDRTPEAHAYVLSRLKELDHGPIHTPPSLRGTVTIPGFHGGATWSGASFDPETGLLYVNSNNIPNVTTLRKGVPGGYPYDFTGYFRFFDQEGYPAVKPPWGMLNAIDLTRGDFAWRTVFGEYPELTAKGVPPTGCENFGGTIVTAGGLVFIGGTRDEKFHAYDKSSGKLLWSYKLDAGGYATPCTYSVSGRQYVCIAAGGGGKIGTRSGDAFVCFALHGSGVQTFRPSGVSGPERPRARTPERQIELFAGGGTGGDGAPAKAANLVQPFSVTFDTAGNTYLAEFTGGDRVRKIDRRGIITTVAGTGERGYGGDGGPATKAKFDGLHTVVYGLDGALYVTDTFNQRIRRIDLKSGLVTTVAGTREKGFSGDGGPATQSKLNEPYCLCFNRTCSRMYVADLGNRRVRAVDMKSGVITTVVGTGERGVPADGVEAKSAPLLDPRAVTMDGMGNLYILERSGHCLRVVDAHGRLNTVAGTGKAGPATEAADTRSTAFNGPKHLCIDRDGSVLIADTENHVVRRYDPKSGRIETIAGTGVDGSAGVGGPARSCQLSRPHGVAVGPNGDLYIADSGNNRVLRIPR